MWNAGIEDEEEEEIPEAFRQTSILSQHVSFLKDFFQSYKKMSTEQMDTLELMIMELYEKFGITNETDLSEKGHEEFPVLKDLYDHMQMRYRHFEKADKQLYTERTLRELCLALHSICVGADSQFFNGHTNIRNGEFITFGVKGLLQANESIRNTMLFNILSYMSHELLTHGNTVASIDELYLFLTNRLAVEYIRNFMKRVRKKDSAMILSTQNLEDFNIEGIRELTKPLFSIPSHAFLFNAGNTDSRFYIDTLQLEESEYELIRYPQRGSCLYKCGNERYNLVVHAPEYKEKLFGDAGGR